MSPGTASDCSCSVCSTPSADLIVQAQIAVGRGSAASRAAVASCAVSGSKADTTSLLSTGSLSRRIALLNPLRRRRAVSMSGGPET